MRGTIGRSGAAADRDSRPRPARRGRLRTTRAVGAAVALTAGLLVGAPGPADAAVFSLTWGEPGDIPVPGRYVAGEVKTDPAVYRPSTSTFWVATSRGPIVRQLGSVGAGVTWTPVPADYDGDGVTDLAVFTRTVTRVGSSHWKILLSSTQTVVDTTFGGGGQPVPADYTGDGKADLALFSAGFWTWRSLTGGPTTSVIWGQGGDIPLPGRYDPHPPLADLAVYRPSNGTWYIRDGVTGAPRSQFWQVVGATPAPEQFACTGLMIPTLFRPSDATWWISNVGDGPLGVLFGAVGGLPVAGDYVGDPGPDVATWTPSTGLWAARDLQSMSPTYPSCVPVPPN